MTEGPQTSVIYCGDCLRFFAAFSFADTARKECERLWMQEQVMIQCVTVKQLIDRDFRKELEYVRMTGG